MKYPKKLSQVIRSFLKSADFVKSETGSISTILRLHCVGLRPVAVCVDRSKTFDHSDSRHRSLVRARCCFCLVCVHTDKRTICPAQLLFDDDRQYEFRSKVSRWLSSHPNAKNPSEH